MASFGLKRPVPKAYLDSSFVEPSAKQQRLAEQQAVAAAAAKKAAHAAAPKASDGVCLQEWACAACDGTHFWGHGSGKDPKKAGPKYAAEKRERVWVCGVSTCRAVLPELDAAQQAEAAAWAQLVAGIGLADAREIKAEAEAEE